MVFEVDVQPLAAGCLRVAGCGGDQAGADAAVPVFGGDEGVEEECVGVAVPRDVHEPDEAVVFVAGADPAETVPVELGAPVDVEGVVVEAGRV